MSQILTTDKGTYFFDPDNKSLTLKENGRFSNVYIGYLLPDKQPVVIKQLHPDLMNDMLAVRMFRQEAFPIYVHPKMAQPIDYYEDDENCILIKKYVSGKTLREISKIKIKNPVVFEVKCMLLVLEILEDFHSEGFVHCDIRPDNILVAEDENGNINFDYPDVHVLDFGLYKSIHADEIYSNIPFSMIYSPPEQMLNYASLVGATSDLYSIALTLYECICKEPPFNHSNPEMLMHLMLNKELEKANGIDSALLEILNKAAAKCKFNLPPAQLAEEEIIMNLKKGIAARYQTAAEFKITLADYLVNEKLKKKRWFF